MAQSSTSSSLKSLPIISETDLVKFHSSHFATTSLDHFAIHFLAPVNHEDEDDGLGYYPDGAKRTLTDEQIAIFRHSEIETLLRERRHAMEAKDHESIDEGHLGVAEDNEDGEIYETAHTESLETESIDTPPQVETQANRKKGKRKNKKGSFKQNVKPDLRKRTWDKVEQGLGSLDYGEDQEKRGSTEDTASQRRRISYEDV